MHPINRMRLDVMRTLPRTGVGFVCREPLRYTIIFTGVIGMCSGSFTGRALRVITLGNRA